jgi:hypothetical protein
MESEKIQESQAGSGLTRFIFESIRRTLPPQASLPKVLSQVLNISESAAYKKTNGKAALGVEELDALVRHFHLSLDAYYYSTAATIPMAYAPLHQTVQHPADFLRQIARIMRLAFQKYPDGQLFYTLSEIPVYLFLRYPELAAFKLFVWGRTAWGLDKRGIEPPMERLVTDPETRQAADDILEWYNRMPSTAFWSESLLDNTLNQLHYFSRTGAMPGRQFAHTVLEQLRLLLDEQQTLAGLGHKHAPLPTETPAPYQLYHNEIAQTGNTFLLVAEEANICLTTHAHPHFLQSSDPAFTRHTLQWFLHLRSRAMLLSSSAEKHRKLFFDALQAKCAKAAETIE